MPIARQSWRKLTRDGIPDLVAVRRPLAYGPVVIEVGSSVAQAVPVHRLRPLYEARRIGPLPERLQFPQVTAVPGKDKKNGRTEK